MGKETKKIKIYEVNMFGSSKTFKTLPLIIDKINNMEPDKRSKAAKILQNINQTSIKLSEVYPLALGEELVTMYVKKYDCFLTSYYHDYDEKFVDYIRNFFKAKVRNFKKNQDIQNNITVPDIIIGLLNEFE